MSRFLESPTHAELDFGLLGQVYYVNHPIHRFEFAIRYNINPASGLDLEERDLTMIAKKVQVGGATIETDVANEYNRDRIVHNKIKYDDTVITMHDVADGKSLRLWEKYYEYYFADGREALGANGFGGSFGAFGYDTLTIQGNNRRYIFDSIDIYQFQAGLANRTRLKNPKIIRFDPDNPDYEDVAGLSEISITFKPEYIQYERGINIPKYILEQMARGGTPVQLSNSVNTFIAGTREDAAELEESLINVQTNDTVYAFSQRAIRNAAGESATVSSINRLIEGTTKSNTSTSSLNSFGQLTENLTRKVPSSSNTSQRSNNQPLSANPKSTDNTDFGSVVNGDEQGGK